MMRKKNQSRKCVLVIGGGIAGATVAERLGRAGVEVHLVEKQADIGGRVKQLGCKATDVCMRCNVCVADQILRSVRSVPSVRLHTSTEVAELRPGGNGRRYTAVLAPSVLPTGEGAERKARNKPSASRAKFVVDANAVVLATGYEPFDPAENASYGYGRIPNVITGLEAEQQLAATHRITRPSDGKPPARIAFIQCVGSRTEEIYRRPDNTDYCSTVCCAYALRMAQCMKYQAKESQITIFYMDIQNFGKGFDAFYRDCKDKMKFIRSRPYEISAGGNGSVRVKYAAEAEVQGQDNAVCEEEFDLLVLAIGIRPPADALDLSHKLGVPMDEQGFFGLKGAAALPDLQREGMYVAGAGESPMDIAGCLAKAEAVSAAILSEE